MAESEELKSLLMKVKEESEKAGIKHSKNVDHGIQSHHVLANRRGKSGKIDFLFWGSKITIDGDCNHETAPWKKSYEKPRQHIKKQRHYLPTTVCVVKAMVFPVVIYGYESWTRKKAECQRTDAFQLWCWRRLLRGPGTARRSNQSVLKEIDPEYSLEALMLNLEYFGHLM